MRSGTPINALFLRRLLAEDDDRLAGFAALLLGRMHRPVDAPEIFSRFNHATVKSQTWLSAIAATQSADGYKFLTDVMKQASYDAYIATWAIGEFDSKEARAVITQAATDMRNGNASAAAFAWALQIHLLPERAGLLAQSDPAQALLLCDALEWLPPPQLNAVTPTLLALLGAKDELVRQRVQMVLCRLSGRPPFVAADGGNTHASSAEELVEYWKAQLNVDSAKPADSPKK